MNTGTPTDTPRDTRDASREIGRWEGHRADADTTCLVVVAGVHGNEPAGVLAARRVLDTLQREQPTAFRGRLVALRGNIAALNHPDPDLRYIAHDLNRLFTDEQIALPAHTSPEHAQMHELLASLRAIRARCARMVLIDLHTTSADMTPVVVLEDAIPARRMARRLPLPLYLGFEEELPGLLMDRATNELGAVAMVVEGGQHRAPQAVRIHEAVIWTMLDGAGILPLRAQPHDMDPVALLRQTAGPEAGRVHDIRHRHGIRHPDFRIREGIRAGQRVRRDETVIATENGDPVTSPVSGLLFMPNMQRRKNPGDDAFFIVRRVNEGWLGLSARLRRQHWLHWLIAHAPGVYPQTDGSLLVDAELAAVLRRQILHLLGYRLIRHDQRPGGHGLRRVLRGVIAFVRAFARGPIPGGPDPDDPRFWIVRRHRLDTTGHQPPSASSNARA